MRIFVAGATGALGSRLVPLLIEGGHQVVGMTRSSDKAADLRAVGAEPVVADGLDRDAVLGAVRQARPEVVVHQLTALAGAISLRRFDKTFALTNRLRSEGTDHLLAAARASGARRLIAQSFAGWPFARVGGPVKTEDAMLDPDPPAELRRTLDAIRQLESAVLEAEGLEGVVLRYGGFYGPGTSAGAGGLMLDQIRGRRFPIVGAGTGVWSFIHIDDAAAATVAAVERGGPGLYNIVDDDPAPVSAWLPELAAAIGARPPRRVPTWVGRLAAGAHGVVLMTQVRGASNAKAKRELGWTPAYPSWRQGFRTGLGSTLRPAPGPHDSATAWPIGRGSCARWRACCGPPAGCCRAGTRSVLRTIMLSRGREAGRALHTRRRVMDWNLELVVVPVTDVDRAKRFYSEQVGFVVDHDTRVSDELRIVQLTPPGSGCSIAVGAGMVGTPPGSLEGIQLVVPDIEAARAALVDRGVEVSNIQHYEGGARVDGRGGRWNSFVFFSDPDGNGWVVQERPTDG